MPNLDHENQLRAAGHLQICGIDEAGRGPLAGPLCVAGVILPPDYSHPVLNDSKQLREAQREELHAELLRDTRIRWHCETLSPAEIDEVNILQATWLGMRRCARALHADAALLDGKPVRDFPVPQRALVKGDSLSFSIAAASIIAKVTRDRLMRALAEKHPGYGFEVHKGYPTPAHLAALKKLGPCPEHRRSFAPVAACFELGL